MTYVEFRKNLLGDVNAFIGELDAIHQDHGMHHNLKVHSFMNVGAKYGIPLNDILVG